VLLALAGRRPRRSSPFRLSYVFGLLFNWPSVAYCLLVASTALVIAQSGVGSPVFWAGLGCAVLAAAGLAVLGRRARGTGATIERAFDAGLGADWRDGVDDELAARLGRRPSLARLLFAPITFRRQGVERLANIRYGPAGRSNLLDVYHSRSRRSAGPTLIYCHGGAFRFGSKNFGARHLLHRLASHGWVCISANYRSTFPDPLTDVKKVIAWVPEHGHEYGADPSVCCSREAQQVVISRCWRP
jgi:alpha/beta hydrolase fold